MCFGNSHMSGLHTLGRFISFMPVVVKTSNRRINVIGHVLFEIYPVSFASLKKLGFIIHIFKTFSIPLPCSCYGG